MKKRLFAGALALLMIIGLLPVSSMLKKPVEAQAAQSTTYTLSADVDGALSTDNNPVKNFFTVSKINTTSRSVGNYTTAYLINGSDKTITFTIPNGAAAKVTAKWTTSNIGVGLKISDTLSETATEKNSLLEYLFSFEVTVTDPGYTITVNDEHADSATVTALYAEGSTLKLSAKGTDLLYWKNSNGVIVATGDKEIPVYYSDTYTAVYAKTGAKVEYLTPYGGVLATYYADDVNGADFKAPEGPTRYGYTFDGWDTDIETVKTSLVAEKDVTVSPKYKDNAGLQYTITIDATDVDGTKDTQTYTVNTVVKASVTDKDSFACWKVGDDVVSYNPTYYFFANRPVTVTAVKNDGSEVSKGAIITEVENSADNNTVIFEYTVPDEYEMTFAGVIASTNAESLASVKDDNITIPAGVYKLGADSTKCSNYNTYRYTLRKAGNDTWYVKPVLTYTDSTGSHTIYGNTVTMK